MSIFILRYFNFLVKLIIIILLNKIYIEIYMEDINLRSKALYKEKFEKIRNLKVAIIGLGGVGSIIPISLVRSNVKSLLLIDKDKVELSNLNRQIGYDKNDINKYKGDVLKYKLSFLNDNLSINIKNEKIDENFDFNIFSSYDYIIDCIDDIKAKILLIKYSLKNNKKIISSLGMGKKYFPSKIEITTLNKTYNDRLAKKLRYELKKEEVDLKKVVVCFSSEITNENFDNNVIASSFFVPNSAGIMIASYLINDYLNIKE